MDRLQDALAETGLCFFHLGIVHRNSTRVITGRQEFRGNFCRQFHRPRRLQIGIGPDRLPLVGQNEIQHALAKLGMRAVVYQAHYIGHAYRSFAGQNKFEIPVFFVFATIRVEVPLIG